MALRGERPARTPARPDRCAWVLAVALSSCTLDKSGTGTTDQLATDSGADSTLVDAIEADTADSAIDSEQPDTFVVDGSLDAAEADTAEAAVETRPPFCDDLDPTLIGCFRFEGNGKDESSYMNDLTVVGATYVPGVDGQAIAFGPSTRVTIVDTPSLAVTTQLTIELWLRLRTLPSTGRMGLVDDDGRFGLFVYPPGTARAQSPMPLDTATNLATATWVHVAYTFDGETMTMFLGGKVSSTQSAPGAFGGASGAGMAIGGNSPSGDPLDGDIDSLRLYRVARTPKQICEAAAASGC